jgi:tetratricopeptide (TPR) repeat protein
VSASDRAFALDSSSGAAKVFFALNRSKRNELSPYVQALARRGAAEEPGVESAIVLSWVLLSVGRTDEGLTVIRDAVRRDSLSPMIWAHAAYRFSQARHFVEAANAGERALALRPSARDSVQLQNSRRWAGLETGDCAGALAEGRAAEDTNLTIESLRCLGRTADADSIVDSELALSTISPTRRAIYLAWRNRPDSAFAVLDRAFPRGLGLTIQHPAFDPYRQHPGYLALRRRMGLDN